MSVLYYKCNNCDFEMILCDQNKKYPAIPVCENCKSKMYYSKQIEEVWLNEMDEDGKYKRKRFWGKNRLRCLAKARMYFECSSNEIEYVYIAPEWVRFISNNFKEIFCEILAWKYSYNLSSNFKKIVTDESDVNGWIAVNPTDKIIAMPSSNYMAALGVTKIKYKEIISLKRDNTEYELKLKTYDESEPYYTLEIDFYPNEKNDDISSVVDILYNDLPVLENEMYITCFFKTGDIPKNSHFSFTRCLNQELDIVCCSIWKDNKYLNICSDVNGIKIKLNQIKYFRIIGDTYVTTDVSGGGGGGSSLAGAILGGVIAGETGAVIGSRKSVDTIQSKTTVHDNRIVYIYSKDQSQILKFDFEIYKTLLEIIPEKEYEIVINAVQQQPVQPVISNNSSDTKDTRSKLKELKSMFDENLITKEEYNHKRQELLEKI